MKTKQLFVLMICLLPVISFAETQFRDVASDYLDFAERKDGLITPAQVEQIGPENLFLINVNSAKQFKAGKNIPGSINMDWREVLDRAHEVPRDRKVMVYCNTMTSH